MEKKYKCKKYIFSHTVIIEKSSIVSTHTISRNFIVQKKLGKTIVYDVCKNLFYVPKHISSRTIKELDIFKNKVISLIGNLPSLFTIEISYSYNLFKKKRFEFKKNVNYYKISINCYNKKNKIGFSKQLVFKYLDFVNVKKEIERLDRIIRYPINHNKELIRTKSLLFENYAFSQILTVFKKDLWLNRDNICNESKIVINSYCNSRNCDNVINCKKKEQLMSSNSKLYEISNNKSFSFDNKNKIDNIYKIYDTGYIITNVYFLNNNKEKRSNFSLMCSGYFIRNNKIEYIFTNRVLNINLLSLINGIKFVSKEKFFSNEFECPDILTEM